MNIKTRHIFTENIYHYLKEFKFNSSNKESWDTALTEEYFYFLKSYFHSQNFYKKILRFTFELYKNSLEHNLLGNNIVLQAWDSSESLLIAYWEENTNFYNSSEVKEKLESGIAIKTKKINRGGHGIPRILSFPRKLHIDTEQEVLFLDIAKPFIYQ